jgi:hypothetical protein
MEGREGFSVNEKTELAFKDALVFLHKLNVQLEKVDHPQIPESAKDEMLKQLEFLLDKLG